MLEAWLSNRRLLAWSVILTASATGTTLTVLHLIP